MANISLDRTHSTGSESELMGLAGKAGPVEAGMHHPQPHPAPPVPFQVLQQEEEGNEVGVGQGAQ